MVPHDDQKSTFTPYRKGPPNYFSRGMQLKLLVMVFLLMGVIALMFEARKPKNWRWLWQLGGDATQQPETAPSSEPPEEVSSNSASPGRGLAIDTRPPLTSDTGEDTSEPRLLAQSQPSLLSSDHGEPTETRPSTEAQLDGWTYVLRRLSKEQRERLRTGLWTWRRGHPLAEDRKADWTALVMRLDDNWSAYHARARAAVARESDLLTAEQTEASIETIEALKRLWHSQKAALEAIGGDTSMTRRQSAVLTTLQRILDKHAWSRVKDNFVLRSAETAAWYRCWEQLQSMPPQGWNRAVGPLNFVQLYSQPDEYRGELITFRGTVRWGYRVASQRERFGIDDYIVLGLLPHAGSSSPVVVYCLDLPADFPAVKPADSSGQGAPLDEDVTVTGYFFKRWLHRCEAGMNLSPLILGKITHWHPHADSREQEKEAAVSMWMLVSSTLGMALLAILIAVGVYRSSSWSRSEAARVASAADSIPSFATNEVRGSVSQTLQELRTTNVDQEAEGRATGDEKPKAPDHDASQ